MKKGLKVFLVGIFSVLFLNSFASVRPILGQVTYQLQSEQWATTNTALITVQINAALDTNQLANLHSDIKNKLTKINANANWHITQFSRSQDQSGLEKVVVLAEARIPSTQLSTLRSSTKKVSAQGEKFSIQNIQYTPSLAEREAVKEKLRNSLYKQIKNQLDNLNKIYPKASYHVYRINFSQNRYAATQVRPMVLAANVSAKRAGGSNLSVSDKITETARVTFIRNLTPKSAQ